MHEGALAAAVGMQTRTASEARSACQHWVFWAICRSYVTLLRYCRDSFIGQVS